MTSDSSPSGPVSTGIVNCKTLTKRLPAFILSLTILFCFQPSAKAESYRLKELFETYYVIEFEGLNIGWWPHYTRLQVFTNDISPGADYTEMTVTTSGTYTMNVPYKGQAGVNKVYTTAIVYLTPYGPNHRFDFTAPMLNAPADLTATTDELNQVTLNWSNTTGYPSADVEYEIYNGNTKIATIAGNLETFTHTGLADGQENVYSVRTVLKGTNRVSEKVSVNGKAFAFELTASVDKVNKVILNWNTTPHLDQGYTLSRDDGIDEVVVDASIPAHQGNIADDEGLLPGVYMMYTITANQDGSHTDSAPGRSRPNGKISGSITTPFGDPIGGVTVKIERTNLPDDTVQKVFYATSSPDDGTYKNEAIYYGYDGADFTITPYFADHMFDPDTIRKSLSPSYPSESSVNFKDTTALTVKGRILNSGCPVPGVSIEVNGIDRNYLTDEDGYYTALVSQPGIHSLKPKKEGHYFDPEEMESIEILDNVDQIDFEDTTMYALSGYLAASCNNFIGTGNLRFFTNGNCIDKSVVTNDTGYYKVLLPPGQYFIELTSFSSADEQLVKSEDVMSYFAQPVAFDLEGTAVYDSTLNRSVAEKSFTYRLPPELNVSILDRSETCDEETIILEQLKTYPVVVSVNETFNDALCHAESGYLVIEQDLTGSDMETDTIWFENGVIDTMYMTIGIPNIVEPYLNTFRLTAFVGNYSETVEYDVLIVGHRPRTATFTTVSPSLPFLILHDPPGDGSSSFMEESTTSNYSFGISMAVDNTLRVYSSAKLGVDIIKGQFVLSETEQWLETELGVSVGIGLASETGFETTVTTTKNFSTSANDDIVGAEGDVYFGGALNLIYAMTDIIEYNYNTCEVEKTVSLAMEPDGFATTFMYTESHITDVLIPQLTALADLYEAEGNDSALVYDKQADVWQQIVDNNHENIENAEFVENISISGGTEYSSSIESTSTWSQTITTSLSLGLDFKLEFGLEESGTGFAVGLENEFQFEIGTENSFGETYAHTTGFTITDDDPGDYMSVDILTDKVYGTPAFNLVAGSTSCPWEEESQSREGVQLRADNYTVYVDDPADEAVFMLQLANISESDEDNTYELIFDPTSNPFGALVSLNGSPVIGNVPIPYEIPAGGFVNATVTVKKGPYNAEFRDLKFILQSSCDGSIHDDVYLDAVFKTSCGTITLEATEPEQVISGSTGNTLSFTVSDYTKESLNTINFRIRTLTTDWVNHYILTGNDIGETETDVTLDFSQLNDGEYYLVATAMCSDAAIDSDIIGITVDRTAPIIQIMSPPDGGELQTGDNISVSFNEDIMPLSEQNIHVARKRGNLTLAFQSGCSPRKLVILPDNQDLEDGDTLIVTVSNVSDMYGNAMDAFNWSFSIPAVNEIFDDPMIDSDKDGIPDASDICILVYNPYQEDFDEDLQGDACDDDIDGDGVLNIIDNCPLTKNPDQLDLDLDGIGDICDEDIDGDNIPNASDNCISVANEDQSDMDLDGEGNRCDEDIDGDGHMNDSDNCPETANPDQSDADGDGIGDVCEISGFNEQPISLPALSVYPNPFESTFSYEMLLEKPTRVKLELCNMMGQVLRVVINDQLPEGVINREIATEGLPGGMYFLRLTINETRTSEKLVKMR